ncbi:MAG: Synechococcus phage [Cyanobacteriota bacterium]|jgi:hypothetical protein
MADQPEVIGCWEINGGTIEQLQRPSGELYYRSCAGGICRYAEDLWCAELYLSQLLAR